MIFVQPSQRTYCQINCPSDSYPLHKALFTSPLPLRLNGNTLIEVPPNRHPSFSGNVTFFAKINQNAGTSGYLIFYYGATTDRPNFSLFLDSSGQNNTRLVLQYIRQDNNDVQGISVEIPSVTNTEHCLTIIFHRDTPFHIFVDDVSPDPNTGITLPSFDLTTGVSYSALIKYSTNVWC